MSVPQKTRPTSLEEMRKRTEGLFSADGYAAGLALQLRPTDVVISPYGKSGTTWTQQIVHTMRTRGDMDFDDISRVVPWIEVSVGLGLDLESEQKAEPRAFKSHLEWDSIPKGGRYIVVLRDPGDVLVSGFKFSEGWFLEPGSVSIEEYAQDEFLKSRGYYKHLRSWWPQRSNDDVLLLGYEHMLRSHVATIERIAAFIGIALDDELLTITREHSSLEFMLAHKDRFDDALIRRRSEELADLPPGSDSAKVRAGKAGSKAELSEALLQALEQAWQEEIAEPLGYPDYDSLLAELR
jgi:hypothetical protein